MPISFTCPHCGRSTNVADQYAGQSGPCAGCGQMITVPGGLATSGPVQKPGVDGAYASTPRGNAGSSSVVTWMVIAIALAFFCLCGGGVLIALLLPAVQSAREAARRAQCTNNLKQIALAMHNYHDVHKAFPAAYVADANGRPMHSWRVALLPYLERADLYERYNFDEPWDSPGNLQVAEQMPETFRCPSFASAPAPGNNLTNYVVIVGDPTVLPPQSMFRPNHWTRMSEVTDGTSNTILVVESSTPVPWTRPDADPTFEQIVSQVEAGPGAMRSVHPGGANVALADGSVRFLSSQLDPQLIRLLVQPADGQAVPPW
ncbi:MAG: DUF1559 domain-containing protein [Pirellulaceae bacterium]